MTPRDWPSVRYTRTAGCIEDHGAGKHCRIWHAIIDGEGIAHQSRTFDVIADIVRDAAESPAKAASEYCMGAGLVSICDLHSGWVEAEEEDSALLHYGKQSGVGVPHIVTIAARFRAADRLVVGETSVSHPHYAVVEVTGNDDRVGSSQATYVRRGRKLSSDGVAAGTCIVGRAALR